MIMGRQDLDQVPADEVDPRHPAHERERLVRGEASHLRRAGARGVRRVEAVDVEGQEDGTVPGAGPDPLEDRLDPRVADLLHRHQLHPELA